MTQLICIGCPMGCELTVTDAADALTVRGHACKIGETYGKEEVTNPVRNITTSVRVTGGDIPVLPVKTSRPIPKGTIFACMEAVRGITVTAPVRMGTIILADAAGTGVDIVSTRPVAAAHMQ